MKGLGLVVAVALGLLGAGSGVGAQPAMKIARIGVVAPAEPSPTDPSIAAFRRGLRDLGHVEGQTVAIEYRYAHGQATRFPDLAADLVRLGVDVMVVGSGPATLAAKRATQTIPIVFVGAADPVRNGLVANLARPGGNVTGLSFTFDEGFAGKWVELIKEAMPRASRVAVLRDPANLAGQMFLRDMQVAAQRLGVNLQPIIVHDVDQLATAFSTMTKVRADALIVDPGLLFNAHHRRLVDLASTHRLPAVHGFRLFVDAGGLMSYSVSLTDLWRRAAIYADRILKGARPADLPVEQPTKFELVINAGTAKALGLTIPPSLLLRADEVIQ